MRKIIPAQYHWPALTAGALSIAAGVVALRSVAAARRRRRLIQSGQIRELREMWTAVGAERVFSRVSAVHGRSDAAPIVLVHGWGISSSYFIPAAERLAADFDVYAPDLPGHGRSSTPPVPYDAPQLARSLLAWMDAMGLERASLVGHSMGCQTAIEAALQQPGRIERLVLMAVVPDPHARSTGEQVRRFVTGGLYERAALWHHLLNDLPRVGRRLVSEFRFMRDYPIEEKLPKVTAPVMLLRGENDPLVPQRWMDEAARLVGAKRVVVIRNWGHTVQFSAPAAVVAAIHPFLREATLQPAAAS